MNQSIFKKALFSVVPAAALALMLAGCGGGGGGTSTTAAPQGGKGSGFGRVATTLRFNSRSAGQSAQATSSSVSIAITITGYYGPDNKPFAPVSSTAEIPVTGGYASISVLEVPVGVNHLLTAVATWPDGATDTIKCIIPKVVDSVESKENADYRTTVIADAAVALAVKNGVTLSNVASSDIDRIAQTVDTFLSAGLTYSQINPQDVLDYETKGGTVSTVTVTPPTASLTAGATSQFTASAVDAYGIPVSASVTWSVTGGIGSIDTNGLFMATTSGQGSILAASGSASGSAAITVTAAPTATSTPPAPICGNGAVESGETCDDGNTVTEACTYGQTSCSVCNSTCQTAAGTTSFCGDSATDTASGETCDDGNAVTETCTYGQTSCSVCNSTCQTAAGAVSGYCGNSVVDSANGETCDAGSSNGQPNQCNSTCNGTTGSVCGNSITEAGETCDDGNTVTESCAYGQTSCSVCNSTCQTASGALTGYCGDGTLDSGNGETCDESSNNGLPSHCNSTCNGTVASVCGDGYIDSGIGETCDDGVNNGTENYCSSTCQNVCKRYLKNFSTDYTGWTVMNGTFTNTGFGLYAASTMGTDMSIPNTDFTNVSSLKMTMVGNIGDTYCSNMGLVLMNGGSVLMSGDLVGCSASAQNLVRLYDGPNVTTAPWTADTSQHTMEVMFNNGTATVNFDGATVISPFDPASIGATITADTIRLSGQTLILPGQTWNTIEVKVDDGCSYVYNCGDGLVNGTETCDDGNIATESCAYGQMSCTVCNSTCQSAAGAVTGYCGDTVVNSGDGETCDDGNTNNGDGCDSTCHIESVCGNGVVESGETCDDGNTNSGDGCSSTCQLEAVCGNSVVEAGETCDDGNITNGDGCSSTCQLEAVCGNNVVEAGETCDGTDLAGASCITQGFTSGTLSCDVSCTSFITTACELCGNGVIEGTEVCDTTALAGASCISLGYTSGTLGCNVSCTSYDTIGCVP